MRRDAKMDNPSALMRQHQSNTDKIWNRMVGTVKKSTETLVFT